MLFISRFPLRLLIVCAVMRLLFCWYIVIRVVTTHGDQQVIVSIQLFPLPSNSTLRFLLALCNRVVGVINIFSL